jgi:hypothetical protein
MVGDMSSCLTSSVVFGRVGAESSVTVVEGGPIAKCDTADSMVIVVFAAEEEGNTTCTVRFRYRLPYSCAHDCLDFTRTRDVDRYDNRELVRCCVREGPFGESGMRLDIINQQHSRR